MFSAALRSSPSTIESPWGLILYADEVIPGNQLSIRHSRKVWVMYFSFIEFGVHLTTLTHMISFDQYNLYHSASAEIISRRLLMIMRAVRRSTRSPDFEGLDMFLSTFTFPRLEQKKTSGIYCLKILITLWILLPIMRYRRKGMTTRMQ